MFPSLSFYVECWRLAYDKVQSRGSAECRMQSWITSRQEIDIIFNRRGAAQTSLVRLCEN